MKLWLPLRQTLKGSRRGEVRGVQPGRQDPRIGQRGRDGQVLGREVRQEPARRKPCAIIVYERSPR